MDDSTLFKQLELYSNAIVGFVVIQSLTFCYHFGTSATFSGVLIPNKVLSLGLLVAAAAIMVLAICANTYIGKILQRATENHRKIIATVYRGKGIAIAIFSALQICVILFYAVLGG